MKKILATITLLSFITIGGFGFVHAYEMQGHAHMGMTPCPFIQGHEAICTMNVLDHLVAWQNAFTTTISNQFLLLFLLLLSMWGLATYTLWKLPDRTRLRFKILSRCKRILTLYELLFSKGILNPKAP